MAGDRIVTVATFPTMGEAEFAKEKLLSVGIDAFISYHPSTLVPFDSHKLNDVKLNVREHSLEEARKIIRANES
ncbi:MAG TPA: hypothetical protein VIK89_05100 [Cytophagaceae bacterium]